MRVEENAGFYIGAGIVFNALGGAIVLGAWVLLAPSNRVGLLALGVLVAVMGLGLLVSGVTKVAKNIEIAATANVSAEEHLRHIRWVVATQYNEERGLTFKPTE